MIFKKQRNDILIIIYINFYYWTVKQKNRDLRQERKELLSTKILTAYTFKNNKAKYPSVGSLKQ